MLCMAHLEACISMLPQRYCLKVVPESAEMDGQIRLADGGSGSGYQYGRLEVFLRGFWSAVCNGEDENFTPDSAQVACKILGFEGGASLVFRQPYVETRNRVCPLPRETFQWNSRGSICLIPAV